MADDVVNPDKVVCPHCGKEIENKDLFRAGMISSIEDFLPPPFDRSQVYPPRELIYWIDHRINIAMPGEMSIDEAARGAIAYVREYMKSLPHGYRLKQACPKREVLLDTDQEEARWVVRCVLLRKSKTPDMGWSDLLDRPLEGELP